MNFQQFLLVLLARYRVVIITLVLTVGTTAVVSLLLPKTYTSETSVVLDLRAADPVAGNMGSGAASPGYMQTQVDIISSDRVARKVVRVLKLDENPNVRQQWQDATEGKTPIEVWLGDLLQQNLDVKPAINSNVISIKYKGADPNFAAAIANGFAQAYIDTNIELKVEPAKQYSAWFDQQSRDLRDRLERARAKLSAYQQEKGLLVTDERLNYENSRLNELQSNLVRAETQATESSSKQHTGNGESLQDVMNSPVVSSLRSEIARSEARLNELGGNVGKNHPQYQRLMAEIASLKEQEALEVARVTRSISTSNKVSREQKVQLEKAIEEHKKRILQLKNERDEASVLQQEVDSAQRSYDAINQRFNQTRLESQVTQTNVAVLSIATPPLKPSAPKITLNVVLSVLLGGMLGVVAALGMEMVDRRVRSRADVELALDVPVLSEMSSIPVRFGRVRAVFRRLRPNRSTFASAN